MVTIATDYRSDLLILTGTAYDEANLTEQQNMRLAGKSSEFSEGISELITKLSSTEKKFSNEKVTTSLTYPKTYNPNRSIIDRVNELSAILSLNPQQALTFVDQVLSKTKVPADFDGFLATPSLSALAEKYFPGTTDLHEQYCKAVQLLLDKVKASRDFYNYREGEIDPAHLQQMFRTISMLAKATEQQPGDILVFPFQSGKKYPGYSPQNTQECFEDTADEFGMRSLDGLSLALTDLGRFSTFEELDPDLVGDMFSPDGDGSFSESPSLGFYDDELKFGTVDVSGARRYYGSGSLRLPQ